MGNRKKRLDQRFYWLIGAIAVAALAALIYPLIGTLDTEREFNELVAQGQPALERVRTDRDLGRNHLGMNATYDYGNRYPTSGPHANNWTLPGVYSEPRLPTMLVHALEHGNVVIYYDSPGDEAMAQLEAWAQLFSDMWSGLVITPMPGLGERLVLTAWTKRLHLTEHDPAAAAAFIDAYRGRGPENPVR